MKTLLVVVATFGAWGTAWAQAGQQPPVGLDGRALASIVCETGCANHATCCRHNLTDQTVSDQISSSAPTWKQMLGGQRVTLSAALSAGVQVDELVRTVDATYAPCGACACVRVPGHQCPTQYRWRVHWKMRYTREQIELILKDAKGDFSVLQSGTWANGTLLEYTPTMAGCACDWGTMNPSDPRPQPLRGGGVGKGSGGVPDKGPGKPQQEEPVERPVFERGRSLTGDFEVTAGVGMAQAGGDNLTSDMGFSFSLAGELRHVLPDGFYLFLQDKFVSAEVETEVVTTDRFQPISVVVEDEEDIDIHALTLGVGYEHALSSQFSIFGKLGLGRYLITGADGVNGHVIGSVDVGTNWNFSDRFSAFFETGLTFGSAHVHVDDGEADLRRTWTVLVGATVRF